MLLILTTYYNYLYVACYNLLNRLVCIENQSFIFRYLGVNAFYFTLKKKTQ